MLVLDGLTARVGLIRAGVDIVNAMGGLVGRLRREKIGTVTRGNYKSRSRLSKGGHIVRGIITQTTCEKLDRGRRMWTTEDRGCRHQEQSEHKRFPNGRHMHPQWETSLSNN